MITDTLAAYDRVGFQVDPVDREDHLGGDLLYYERKWRQRESISDTIEDIEISRWRDLQNKVRIEEAKLLKQRIFEERKNDPDTRFIVLGDFNSAYYSL